MAGQTEPLQQRMKQLDQVRRRSRRLPLWVATSGLGLAVAGCAVWDARPGSPFPFALTTLSALMALAALAAGEVFFRWKDGLVSRYVDLAERRVTEFEESSDATFIINEAA